MRPRLVPSAKLIGTSTPPAEMPWTVRAGKSVVGAIGLSDLLARELSKPRTRPLQPSRGQASPKPGLAGLPQAILESLTRETHIGINRMGGALPARWGA